MTCEELLRLLDEDRLAGSPEAAEHLESCQECRYAAQWWQMVKRELHEMRDEPAPPFLHTRVMAHVRDGSRARRWWQAVPRLSWAGPALVGVVLLVASGYGLWQVMRPAEAPLGVPVPREVRDAGAVDAKRRATQPEKTAFADGVSEEIAKPKGDTYASGAPAPVELAKSVVAPPPAAEAQLAPLPVGGETVAGKQVASKLTDSEQRLGEKELARALETRAPETQQQLGQGMLTNQNAVTNQAGLADASRTQQNTLPGGVPSSANVLSNQAQHNQAPANQERVDTLRAAEQERARPRQETDKLQVAELVEGKREERTKAATIPAPVSTVTCAVVAEAGGSVRGIALTPELAPAAGVVIAFTVNDDGGVVLDAKQKAGPSTPLPQALATLGLPPGRYSLRRIGR